MDEDFKNLWECITNSNKFLREISDTLHDLVEYLDND